MKTEERVVATIGLKDMVMVDAPDKSLIDPKEGAQEVRRIIDTFKKSDGEEPLFFETVEKPWGSYTVLEKGIGFKIKRLTIKPGARLSLQRHRQRSEHWVVVTGTAKVTRGDEVYLVQTNKSTYIHVYAKHRLENTGDGPLQVVEVQIGGYLEEDDIERFEDDYGR